MIFGCLRNVWYLIQVQILVHGEVDFQSKGKFLPQAFFFIVPLIKS